MVGPTEALLLDVRALYARLDRSVFLRAMDALHVVTAQAESFDQIYSNDRHVLAACGPLGLKGIDPTAA